MQKKGARKDAGEMIFARARLSINAHGVGTMEEEPVVAEVEKTGSKWRAFDPAYALLVIAVVIAITYAVKVSRENSALQKREREYSGTLSGPQTAQSGDIVPAFRTVDLQGRQVEIVYDGTKKFLFFIFSPTCSVCEHEIPLWNGLAETTTAKKIEIRGISIDSLEDSKKSAIGKDISFDLLVMPDMPTRRAYRVVSIPQVMIVSEHGTIEWVHYGVMTQKKVAELQSRLAGGG